MTERELIILLKDGDTAAFDRIYDLYAGRLYAFAMKLYDSHVIAEDILQETFIYLWINRSSIKNETSIKSLLFTIAHHGLINAYNKLRRISLVEDMTMHDLAVDTNMVETIEYHELESRLSRYIDQLPPTQRLVVKMSKFESLSNKEIAEHLGLSVQTVKNALSNGLKTLRRFLNDEVALTIIGLILVNFAEHEVLI